MLATDRHSQIRKHMWEEKKNIDHQFDVWHFCKNVKQKLKIVYKKASCNDLCPWLKSMTHHFWWACSTCEGYGEKNGLVWLMIHQPNGR